MKSSLIKGHFINLRAFRSFYYSSMHTIKMTSQWQEKVEKVWIVPKTVYQYNSKTELQKHSMTSPELRTKELNNVSWTDKDVAKVDQKNQCIYNFGIRMLNTAAIVKNRKRKQKTRQIWKYLLDILRESKITNRKKQQIDIWEKNERFAKVPWDPFLQNQKGSAQIPAIKTAPISWSVLLTTSAHTNWNWHKIQKTRGKHREFV